MKKRPIPKEWTPDLVVEGKASAAGIDSEFYNKTLIKFREGFYIDGESLNRKFWQYLNKQLVARKNRSAGQKNRHSTPAAYKTFKRAPVERSDRVTTKQNIKQLLKIINTA